MLLGASLWGAHGVQQDAAMHGSHTHIVRTVQLEG